MQTTMIRPAESHSDSPSEIREQLAEGQRLTAAQQWKAASDLLWSAFESAVCLSLTQLGEQTDRPIQISDTPLGLSGQAVAYGVIDPQDRDTVMRLLSVNLADKDILQQAAYITERTLDEAAQ